MVFASNIFYLVRNLVVNCIFIFLALEPYAIRVLNFIVVPRSRVRIYTATKLLTFALTTEDFRIVLRVNMLKQLLLILAATNVDLLLGALVDELLGHGPCR